MPAPHGRDILITCIGNDVFSTLLQTDTGMAYEEAKSVITITFKNKRAKEHPSYQKNDA